MIREDERNANLTLGGNGTANGEGVCGKLLLEFVVLGAGFGESGDGDRGDFGDGLLAAVTKRNFDGDLERERRSERTAEVTST